MIDKNFLRVDVIALWALAHLLCAAAGAQGDLSDAQRNAWKRPDTIPFPPDNA